MVAQNKKNKKIKTFKINTNFTFENNNPSFSPKFLQFYLDVWKD